MLARAHARGGLDRKAGDDSERRSRSSKGQLLFELYSPTLVNAQEEYLAATCSGNTMLFLSMRPGIV